MHCDECALSTRGSIVTSLKIDIVEGWVARSASDEIELARRGRDDGIALQTPVGSSGRSVQSEGLVRR